MLGIFGGQRQGQGRGFLNTIFPGKKVENIMIEPAIFIDNADPGRAATTPDVQGRMYRTGYCTYIRTWLDVTQLAIRAPRA